LEIKESGKGGKQTWLLSEIGFPQKKIFFLFYIDIRFISDNKCGRVIVFWKKEIKEILLPILCIVPISIIDIITEYHAIPTYTSNRFLSPFTRSYFVINQFGELRYVWTKKETMIIKLFIIVVSVLLSLIWLESWNNP